MKTLRLITEYWELIVGSATAIGSVFGWVAVQKRNKEQSSQKLYEQMEILKKKVILQVSKEVELSTTIAQRDKIIEGLKIHCPDCYESFMKTRSK